MSNQQNFMEDEEVVVHNQALDEFLENAYRRYAVLTILDRALPDARDGLKPVQRRILYAMHEMGLLHSSEHKKSARVVGDVLGKFHPHGDASVYDAMVRLAQDFSMREPLVDGQGNYGSIDGDSAAAMRYTEARLTNLGECLLYDLDKETVNWKPNFDGSLKEPVVLPARFPNLLVNGASGIAVGMSTNILPHNLAEVCEAVIYVAKNWKNKDKISIETILQLIPGPDLPTGGILYRYRTNGDNNNVDMIQQAYTTGNATIVCQAKADIRDIGGGKSEIVVTELPYQVQKSTILERIASKRDKFTGITDVRDESDYSGMRVVFEVARGTDPQDVLERLLTYTQMRSSLSYNAMALAQQHQDSIRSVPRYLSLLDMLGQFIQHRLDVITRRSKYELNKAEARSHILEGLLKALSMIDEVIDIIRHSQTTDTAKKNLMKKLNLTQIQAQSILDMPLRRLASLERKKLEDELKELLERIKELKTILASEKKRLDIVVHETEAIKDQYGTPRRTIIIEDEEGHHNSVTVADLVLPKEQQIIIITKSSIFRYDSSHYRDGLQKRKPTTRSVDVPMLTLTVNPNDSIIMISDHGKIWKANVGRIPQKAENQDFGLDDDHHIVGCEIVRKDMLLILLTKNGYIKKVKLDDVLDHITEGIWSPIIGFTNEDDRVIYADVGTDDSQVVLCTGSNDKDHSRVLRFSIDGFNSQATPSAKGVTAIKLNNDYVISASMINEKLQISEFFALFLTEKGYIKKVAIEEFPLQQRGGQGVIGWKSSKNSGVLTGFIVGTKNDVINIYSHKGKRIKLDLEDIPTAGRAGKGEQFEKVLNIKEKMFLNDYFAGISIT